MLLLVLMMSFEDLLARVTRAFVETIFCSCNQASTSTLKSLCEESRLTLLLHNLGKHNCKRRQGLAEASSEYDHGLVQFDLRINTTTSPPGAASLLRLTIDWLRTHTRVGVEPST